MAEPSHESTRPVRRQSISRDPEPLGAGCAVRVLWLIGGPVAVAFTAAVLARHETSNVFVVAAVFWGSVLAMLGLRYLDVTRLGGLTADGEPATLAHFRRYSLTVAVTAVALFGAALLVRG